MAKLKNICSVFFLIFILVFGMGWIGNVYADGGPGKGQGWSKNQGWGKGQGWKKGKDKSTAKANKHADKLYRVKFDKKDKGTITKYFSASPFPVTTLPPGIAKNLQRGKPLPPGIQKVFLPSGLVSQLPARPGYEYLGVGRDAVLMDSKTGRVADILINVLR